MNRRTYQLEGEPQGQGGGEPAQPDLMGYPSVEALVKAKRESDQEFRNLRAGYQTLEQRLQQVEQSFRPAVPQRHGRPEDRLSEVGVPVDAVEAMIEERVAQRVTQAFQPLAQMATARNKLMGEYPDYQKFEAEIAAHIQSDPEREQRYNRMFQADPVGALEWAMGQYSENRRAQHKSSPQRGREPAEVAEAQLPSVRNGDARRAPQGGADAAQLTELANRYRETGSRRDAEAYAKARLHTVIKDDFLNQ